MEISDETLQCIDCNAEFPFSAGEADFYQSRGLVKPKRCAECRRKRKALRGVPNVR